MQTGLMVIATKDLISPDQKVGIAVSARSNATSEVGSQQIAFDTNKQAAGQNWKEGGSGVTPNKMDAGNSNTSQQKNHPHSSKNDEGQYDIREGAIQQDVKDESDRMSFDSDVKPETATSNKKEVGRFETEPEAYQFVENMSHQPEVVTSYNNNGSFQSVEPEISQPIEKAGRYTEMMASIETEIHQPSESANPQPEMMVSNGDGAGHYQSKTARAMRELNEVAGTAQPEQSDPVNHGQADDSVEAISAEPEAHRPFDSRSHQPEMVASNEPLVHQPDQSTNRQQEMPDFNGDGAVRYQSKTAHAMRKFNEIAGTAKSTQKTSWDGDGRRVNEQSDGNSISTAGSNSRPERSQRMKVDIPEELLLASAQRINRVERIMQNGPRMVER
jgi:hypothetical protein